LIGRRKGALRSSPKPFFAREPVETRSRARSLAGKCF
jgi:hypothetical protein